MEKIYIWGAGNLANDILNAFEQSLPAYRNNEEFYIAGIIDNNKSRWNGLFHGIEIVSPGKAIAEGFDYIVILSDMEYLIREQIVNGYHLPDDKIQTRWYLLELVLRLKYRDTQDEEIQSVLKYWKGKRISLFNNFLPDIDKHNEVIWDRELNLPYIEFSDIEGKIKKMYYPRNYRFEVLQGKQVVPDILHEQLADSPHLYCYNGHDVNEGDVILDGGVCEGNFSLRYADIASKIYLVESNPDWKEPLYYTFKEYQDKIVYCDKMLSNRDGYYYVSIDTLVKDKLDFLKLDIEGAEVAAVAGGKNTLHRNRVKCSVCSYHKSEDEKLLRALFTSYGYDTDVSKGYMTFLWDCDIWYNADFRRGMVYAEKF